MFRKLLKLLFMTKEDMFNEVRNLVVVTNKQRRCIIYRLFVKALYNSITPKVTSIGQSIRVQIFYLPIGTLPNTQYTISVVLSIKDPWYIKPFIENKQGYIEQYTPIASFSHDAFITNPQTASKKTPDYVMYLNNPSSWYPFKDSDYDTMTTMETFARTHTFEKYKDRVLHYTNPLGFA